MRAFGATRDCPLLKVVDFICEFVEGLVFLVLHFLGDAFEVNAEEFFASLVGDQQVFGCVLIKTFSHFSFELVQELFLLIAHCCLSKDSYCLSFDFLIELLHLIVIKGCTLIKLLIKMSVENSFRLLRGFEALVAADVGPAVLD